MFAVLGVSFFIPLRPRYASVVDGPLYQHPTLAFVVAYPHVVGGRRRGATVSRLIHVESHRDTPLGRPLRRPKSISPTIFTARWRSVLPGLSHSSIDLIEPSSGAVQKLANNPRKKAVGLLRAGNVYEAARLGKDSFPLF